MLERITGLLGLKRAVGCAPPFLFKLPRCEVDVPLMVVKGGSHLTWVSSVSLQAELSEQYF